jgi:DNA-binding NarL/FixJ family response regulator
MNATALAPVGKPKILSVLLANELAFVQEGLAALCRLNPRYEVIGRASGGLEASRLIHEHRPDLAVVDLRILSLTELVNLPTKVILLASREDRDMAGRYLYAGAKGFLLESASSQEFLEAFVEVAAGGVYVSRGLDLLDGLRRQRSMLRNAPPPRELQVLSLLAQGLRGKEIAGQLGLSPTTISTLRARLMRRLDIHNVAGLVQYASLKTTSSAATTSSRRGFPAIWRS